MERVLTIHRDFFDSRLKKEDSIHKKKLKTMANISRRLTSKDHIVKKTRILMNPLTFLINLDDNKDNKKK